MNNYNDMNKNQLRAACKEHGIIGYGKMTVSEMRDKLFFAAAPEVPVEAVAPVEAPVPVEAPAARKIEKDREERNGVKRPSAGTVCRAVWDFLDEVVDTGIQPTAALVKEEAVKAGWNQNNASIELYQWRKFNGIRGRQ